MIKARIIIHKPEESFSENATEIFKHFDEKEIELAFLPAIGNSIDLSAFMDDSLSSDAIVELSDSGYPIITDILITGPNSIIIWV